MKTLNTWKTVERRADGAVISSIWKTEAEARARAAKTGCEVFPFPCYKYGKNLYPANPNLFGVRS